MSLASAHDLAVASIGVLACWHDTRSRRLPNYLTLGGALLALPFAVGETGIWLASPVGDLVLLMIAGLALRQAAGKTGARLGIFHAAA